MELFTEQGFSGTGIDAVLRRVGIPKGSFYYYFDSKNDFGRQVMAAYDLYFAGKLERFLEAEDRPPLQRLRDFMEDAKRGMQRHGFNRGCLVGNLGQETAVLPEDFRQELSAILLRWQKRTAHCLQEAQRRGELSSTANCDDWAAFFWTGWEGAVLRSRLVRSSEPLDNFMRHFLKSLPTRRLLPTVDHDSSDT